MDSWPLYGYDASNTWSAPDISTPNHPELAWRLELPSGQFTAPVIHDGHVYVNHPSEGAGDEALLYALDLETGDVQWTHPTGAIGHIWSTPTIVEEAGIVLLSLEESDQPLTAFDLEDGTVRWKRPLPEGRRDLTATWDGEAIYVGGYELLALVPESGDIVWSYQGETNTVENMNGDLVDVPPESTSHPAVNDESLYISFKHAEGFRGEKGPYYGYSMKRIDRSTGDVVWSVEPKEAMTRLGLRDDLLYAFGRSTVACYDTKDAERIWRFVDDMGENRALVISKEAAYLGENGNILAIDLETGTIRWRRRLPGGIHGMSLIDENLYASSSTTYSDYSGSPMERPEGLHALDPGTGRVEWTYEPEDNASSHPVASDEHILFGSSRGLNALSDG